MSEFKNAKAGDEIPVLEKYVAKYQPIYYAGASGDFNPIHIDPEFGKMVGLGGNILQGLCTMAFTAQCMTDWAGDPGLLGRLKVRFAESVRPEDTVKVAGRVEADDTGAVRCEIWAENQNGVKVITHANAELRKSR